MCRINAFSFYDFMWLFKKCGVASKQMWLDTIIAWAYTKFWFLSTFSLLCAVNIFLVCFPVQMHVVQIDENFFNGIFLIGRKEIRLRLLQNIGNVQCCLCRTRCLFDILTAISASEYGVCVLVKCSIIFCIPIAAFFFKKKFFFSTYLLLKFVVYFIQ